MLEGIGKLFYAILRNFDFFFLSILTQKFGKKYAKRLLLGNEFDPEKNMP